MKSAQGKMSLAAEKAHRTARWAKTMTKWLISMNQNSGAQWHVIDFVGSAGAESRGIVDLLAIRKDHRKPRAPLDRGDLFEIVLIQSKGGGAVRPKASDVERLMLVKRKYHAKAIVLAEWKRGKAPQLFELVRGRWVERMAESLF